MKIIKRKKSGFTLIELLVVIVIIGFLVTAGMMNYQTVLERGKTGQALTEIGKMSGSVARYLVFSDALPTDIRDLDVDFINVQADNMSYTTKFYLLGLSQDGTGYRITATRQNNTNDFGAYTVYYTSTNGQLYCTSPGTKACTKILDAIEI